MLELKYRIFDKVHNKIIGIFTLKELCLSDIFVDYGIMNIAIDVFTGQITEKGIEIFSGDIFDTYIGTPFINPGIVEWSNSVSAFIVNVLYDSDFNLPISKCLHFPIIGNIHEKHEFLEDWCRLK
jgi:hypothetical protein